jgi:hypothetical protein
VIIDCCRPPDVQGQTKKRSSGKELRFLFSCILKQPELQAVAAERPQLLYLYLSPIRKYGGCRRLRR